jgi:YVTN family beta-propeller protein
MLSMFLTLRNRSPRRAGAGRRFGLLTSLVLATTAISALPATDAAAAVPGGPALYVVNSGDGSVSSVDSSSNTTTSSIEVGSVPYGVALNASGSLAYPAAPSR